MASPRVSRGRQTEALVAKYMREFPGGWPSAKRRSASLPGTDIYDCRLLAPEVKATRGVPLISALKQAEKNSAVFDLERFETRPKYRSLPFVIWRPDGYGPEKIDQWVVAFTFKNALETLVKAGY